VQRSGSSKETYHTQNSKINRQEIEKIVPRLFPKSVSLQINIISFN